MAPRSRAASNTEDNLAAWTAEADADLAAGRTRTLNEVAAEADAEDHDGHTIDVGVPTSVGGMPLGEWNARRAEQFWLDRRADGCWEVWGLDGGRPKVLFSSGLSSEQALRDLKTVSETHVLRPAPET